MAIVKSKVREILSLGMRGKFAYPCQLGEFTIGYSRLGEFNKMSGVYQVKHTKKGRQYSRMTYAAPPYSTTPEIIASRNLFKSAMENWALQDSAARRWWNLKADPLQMHGVNLFVKTYIESH